MDKASEFSGRTENDYIQQLESLARQAEQNQRCFNNFFYKAQIALMITRDNVIIDVNQSCMELFGYSSRQEMEGSSFLDQVDPQYREKVAEKIDRRLQGFLDPVGYEVIAVRKDGTRIDCDILAGCIELDNVPATLVAITNITERKQAEQALITREALLHSFLQNAPVALVLTNGSMINHVNKVFLNIFGYETINQVQGTPIINLFAPQCRQMLLDSVHSISELKTLELETMGLYKNGSQFPINVQISRIQIGEDYFYMTAFQDISERNRTRAALAESEEKYRTLMENLDIGVIRISPQGDILAGNPTAANMLGFTCVNEILRVNILDLYQHPYEREDFLKKVFQNQIVMHREVRMVRSNDAANWVASVTARMHRDELGNMAWIDVVIDDITEAKQIEEELNRSRMEAEKASIAKSQFLSNISHELRTPLNVIFGYSQLLYREGNLTPEQRGYIEVINHSGEHLLGLINDILEISKIENGQYEVCPKTFDLYRTLNNIENMVRLRAEVKGLRFNVELSSVLPRYIRADERKLRQVLLNLLGNAIKFTDQGYVILRVYDKLSANGYWPRGIYFEVEDTGIGLSEYETEEIFKPFVQTAVGKKSREGTGLGLAISKNYVQIMGGDILVKSQPGKGSLFRCCIQAEAPDMNELNLLPDRRRVIRLAPGHSNIRILIAEDEEYSRSFIKQMLERVGFDVKAVVNGKEAVDLLGDTDQTSQWQPDLILMDMRMPVMRGEEATQRIKATAQGKDIIIIALTASAFLEERDKLINLGCDDFIYKPVTEMILFDRIARHLGVKYIYQDDEQLLKAPMDNRLEAQDFAGVTETWLNIFKYAAITGDTSRMLSIADELPESYDTLRVNLKNLVQKYQLETILSVIDSIQGELP